MKTRRRLLLAVAVILVITTLLTASCDEYANYTPSAADLTTIVEQIPAGPTRDAVQATAVARYLAADQAEQTITAAQAAESAAQAELNRQTMALTADAQATSNAFNAQATQQAMNALSTRQAHEFRTTATAEIVQVTAQAAAIEATRAADERHWAATLTAEARNIEATATAQHRADVATATQQAKDDRSTATQESANATTGAVHATMTRQAEKRETVLGYGRDYGLPLLLLAILCAAICLVVYAILEFRKRPVVMEQSLLGDSQQMRIPTDDGKGYTFVDVDLLPSGVVTIRTDGSVDAPILRDETREEADKERDQHLNALTRPRIGEGHRGHSAALPAVQPKIPGLRTLRIVRTLDQLGKTGAMSGPLIESLSADWEE